MVSIKWCLKQNSGLKIIEPNKNMAESYLNMAKESITALNCLKESRLWTATTSYYVFYYSLYSLMLQIGIKCEIHSCSLEFMKEFLMNFYSEKDLESINKAFKARINLQYYTDRPVNDAVINEIKTYCKNFYIKTKDLHANIKEKQIEEIRNKLNSHIKSKNIT